MPQKRLGAKPLSPAERQARYKARKAKSRDLGMPPADGKNTHELIEIAKTSPEGVGGVMLRALWRREFDLASHGLDVLDALISGGHLTNGRGSELHDILRDELRLLTSRIHRVGTLAKKARIAQP
jgi:hypothetical protein